MTIAPQIPHVTGETLERELSTGQPLVLDIYATWCGPCRMLAPAFEALAIEYAGRVRFAKADVEQAPEVAERFGVAGVPTLLFFRDGALAGRIVGVPSGGKLRAALDDLASRGAA